MLSFRRILLMIIFLIGLLSVWNYWPVKAIPAGIKIDSLVVVKKDRVMHAYSNGQHILTYSVTLGKEPEGAKQWEGDQRTPEGNYTIVDKNPQSDFYKNLGVSYPNADDKLRASKMKRSPGGDIKIHGLKNGFGWVGRLHRLQNWTNGCIALTDAELEELYQHVSIGAALTIRP